MNDPIPLVDLGAQQREIHDEVMAEVNEVFTHTAFVGGPHVAAFESEYARYVGVDHCVGVANGTDALELALRAVGVGGGDEVILPANTFIATAEAVLRAGATPVLVDVDKDALLMDPSRVAEAITGRTRAIVPVHLYGQTAPVEVIATAAPGIAVVEDAAQSQGARRHGVSAGALGDLAATSFYPGKNLGAAGDAGAVTTSDAEAAQRVRLLGNHGSAVKYVHDTLGFNSRLDAVQAVQLRHKLRRLEGWNDARRQAAARYDDLLAGMEDVTRPATLDGNTHVWHLYVVRVPHRDRVVKDLNRHGVGAAIHYPTPLHRTPAIAGRSRAGGDLTVADAAADRLLSLPMYPHISAGQQERVVAALTAALGR